MFLHSHGVGTARAVRIYKTYGPDAIQVMTENPYRLARDIRGVGFKTADAIAMKLGIEKTAIVRVRAGISYALTEAMDEGHCGLPTEELVPLAEKLLVTLSKRRPIAGFTPDSSRSNTWVSKPRCTENSPANSPIGPAPVMSTLAGDQLDRLPIFSMWSHALATTVAGSSSTPRSPRA